MARNERFTDEVEAASVRLLVVALERFRSAVASVPEQEEVKALTVFLEILVKYMAVAMIAINRLGEADTTEQIAQELHEWIHKGACPGPDVCPLHAQHEGPS